MRTRISFERKHLIIPDLTAGSQKHFSCVMGMTISNSDKHLMAESSIWSDLLSDITNVFCAWEFLIGFQVWITIMDTLPGKNSEGHDHSPCAICFTLAVCKDS